MRGFAFAVLVYEILFNITYMLSRVLRHLPEHPHEHHEPLVLVVAIFHGIFSPIMFAALLAFFIRAAVVYGRGDNFFKNHPILTAIFIGAWTLSIFSGVLFFFLLYIR